VDEFERILSEHPLLQGLSPGQIHMLAGCASEARFDAGDFIYREGQEANTCYFIRSGMVAVQINAGQPGPVTVETVSEGGIVGWSWIVPPYRSHFDTRAMEATSAIVIDTRCFREKMAQDHDLGYEFLKRFVQVVVHRLRAARIQLLDIYARS
jgi:CRP/FNR family cyclic AMP-dependent transcriptional regulator